MRRTLTVLVLAFASGLLAVLFACNAHAGESYPRAQSWPMYQYVPGHNAVFAGRLHVQWKYNSGAKINGGLAAVANSLYAANFKGQTFSLNLKTGNPQWTSDAHNVVMTTPVISGNVVVVGTGKNWVTADTKDIYLWSVPQGDDVIAYRSSDGKFLWSAHTLGEDMPSGGLYGSLMIWANGDDHVYAVNLLTGKIAWTQAVPGADTMGSTAIDGKTAYVIASLGEPYEYGVNTHVVALDAASGRVLWSAPYGNADCSPTVGDGMVFVEASINFPHKPFPIAGYNELYAIDQTTGKLRWEYRDPDNGFYTHVGSSERAVAAMYHDGVLYQSFPVPADFGAFDAATGKVLWKFETEGTVKMSPVFKDGRLYFGDSSGLLYEVDAKTGNVIDTMSFNKPFATSSPIIIGQTLFVANSTTIYAIPLEKI